MSTELIGQKIEHYQIEGIIGKGGMGTVYRAIDVNLARPVAVKIMHEQYAAEREFQQRFQQEAQAAARLEHPSIVSVYHFGREHGLLYLVMELIPGLSLGTYMKQLAARGQVIRLDETVSLMAQVADALGYAHRKGVVHRDVKPDNIIVKQLNQAERPDEPPLRAVMTDFGLAKLMEGGVETKSGEFMGTLAYISPEQIMDTSLDGRSDIYSLGVVLFQLATGQSTGHDR
jgi:serine/threonine protein kinase